MPTDEATRNKAKCIMERVAAKLGHDSLTWRVVPTSNKSLGASAVAVEPHIEQWFLSAHGLKDNLETEQQVRQSRSKLLFVFSYVLWNCVSVRIHTLGHSSGF